MPDHRHAPEKPLRSGYTTGACAAASARGAALMLSGQALVEQVTIDLPTGDNATFPLHGQSFSAETASCFVVKDAGDDPDVTHGVEVWAKVTHAPFDAAQGTDRWLGGVAAAPEEGRNILIIGGVGIGRVTKPGLAVPPGEWAINPVPRRMILAAVGAVFPAGDVTVEIAIPDGELRARKTLNERLGIIGGLSILGTTGIVRPISTKAWTDTLDAALDVAKACGCTTVVLSTGRSSELAAQTFLNRTPLKRPAHLPEEAYIMMGDHVAYALQACARRGFARPLIACQFAKLLKIACGHANTHAAASELDLATLKAWAETESLPPDIIDLICRANTARQIVVESGFDRQLIAMAACHAGNAARSHAATLEARFLVCDYEGRVVCDSEIG